MKNPELWGKSLSILVKAFFSGTLKHEEPCGCAIGNLIAGNNGFEINKTIRQGIWSYTDNGVFIQEFWNNVQAYGRRHNCISNESDLGKKELLSTGYSLDETLLIERAFESTRLIGCDDNGDNGDMDGYLGLMAVVDTLMEIHEATKEEAQQAKELFVLTDAG